MGNAAHENTESSFSKIVADNGSIEQSLDGFVERALDRVQDARTAGNSLVAEEDQLRQTSRLWMLLGIFSN